MNEKVQAATNQETDNNTQESLRDQILAVNDIKIKRVEVPEWNTHVYLKTISGASRDMLDSEYLQVDEKGRVKVDRSNLKAKFLVHTLCDSEGNLLFKPEDAGALGKKSASAINRLFEEAQELNGLDAKAVDRALDAFADAPSD